MTISQSSAGSGSEAETCTIRAFQFPEEYPAALQLWQNSGPGVNVGRSDAPAEIEKKLARDPDLFLVAVRGDQLIGTVIAGFDGRRGMIYHLAVADLFQNMGIGSALLDEVESRLRAKGCLKSYLMVTPANMAVAPYYLKRGWRAMDVTIFGKELQ